MLIYNELIINMASSNNETHLQDTCFDTRKRHLEVDTQMDISNDSKRSNYGSGKIVNQKKKTTIVC